MLFDQIGKTKDMAGAAGMRQTAFERGPSQPDNRLHRFDVFRTNLYAEVTPRTIPDSIIFLKRCQPHTYRRRRLARVGEKPIGLRQSGRAEKSLRNFMHGTSRYAGATHDASIHIVKMRIGMFCRRGDGIMHWLNHRHQPGMYIANLPPTRSHIHDQILDYRQVAERRDCDAPMSLKFFTEGGAAG